MKIHVLRATELGADLIAAWRKIQATNPALASPYFAPEFTQAVGAVRDDAYVAVLEDAAAPHGGITGFFPYQRHGNRGKPIGSPVSDYHGVISAPDTRFDAAELIRACGIHLLDFDHLIASQAPFQAFHKKREPSYLIDLEHGFEALARAKRKAGAQEVVRFASHWRRLEADLGPVRFVPRGNDSTVLNELMAWKGRQFSETGLVDIFTFDWTRGLVERILATQGETFQGVLSALYAGDRLIAAHLGMSTPSIVHYWFPAYNRAYAHYSPGSMLLLEMVRDAAERGITTFDLGKGKAPYKRRLHTSTVMVAEGYLGRPSWPLVLRAIRSGAEKLARSSFLFPVARVPGRIVRRYERRLELR